MAGLASVDRESGLEGLERAFEQFPALLARQQDNRLPDALYKNVVAFEAKFLRQPNSLATPDGE